MAWGEPATGSSCRCRGMLPAEGSAAFVVLPTHIISCTGYRSPLSFSCSALLSPALPTPPRCPPSSQVYMERNYQLRAVCRMDRNYTAAVTNTLFQDNSCHLVGGMYIRNVGHTIGPNVTFSRNDAFMAGSFAGALYLTAEVRCDKTQRGVWAGPPTLRPAYCPYLRSTNRLQGSSLRASSNLTARLLMLTIVRCGGLVLSACAALC
eukprot:360517-Chlamydomonas_euryale.AAC.1